MVIHGKRRTKKQNLKLVFKVQNAFPYLTADEKELLVSGLCLDCQKEVFDSDDNYDEEPDINLDCGFDPYLGCFTDDC